MIAIASGCCIAEPSPMPNANGVSARIGDSLLERATAAAEERQLSQNSLVAYRRTWLKIIADMAVVLSRVQSWCVDRF